MNRPEARLAKLEVAELDAAQRDVYDAIAGGRRAQGPFAVTDAQGRLEGPFNAMLLSPPLGGALQALGGAVRYGSQLSDRARELAILVVARHHDSAFETYAHEAVGRAAGLGELELDAVREVRHASLADPDERLVAETAHALAVRSDLADEEYDAAVHVLGEAGLFELTTLVGYYATLALQLRVFRVPLPS